MRIHFMQAQRRVYMSRNRITCAVLIHVCTYQFYMLWAEHTPRAPNKCVSPMSTQKIRSNIRRRSIPDTRTIILCDTIFRIGSQRARAHRKSPALYSRTLLLMGCSARTRFRGVMREGGAFYTQNRQAAFIFCVLQG